MAEYISRDTAIARLTRLEVTDKLATMADAKREIADMPAADVTPVRHGRWIGSSGIFQGKCSVCGYMTYDKSADWARNYWPHCPNCGAKMDGKDGDGNG